MLSTLEVSQTVREMRKHRVPTLVTGSKADRNQLILCIKRLRGVFPPETGFLPSLSHVGGCTKLVRASENTEIGGVPKISQLGSCYKYRSPGLNLRLTENVSQCLGVCIGQASQVVQVIS